MLLPRPNSRHVACRYYLNGADAFRLKLLLPVTEKRKAQLAAQELEGLTLQSQQPQQADERSSISEISSSHHATAPLQASQVQSESIGEQQASWKLQKGSDPSQEQNDLFWRLDALKS